MKKIFLIIISVMSLASVKAEDVLQVIPFTTNAGMTEDDEVSFQVALTNSHNYTALQFDLYLPEGLTICDEVVYLNEDRCPNTVSKRGVVTFKHSAEMTDKGNGHYFVTIYAQNLETFIGTSGPLFELYFTTDENMAEGYYPITISGTKLGISGTEGVYPATSTSYVKIVSDSKPSPEFNSSVLNGYVPSFVVEEINNEENITSLDMSNVDATGADIVLSNPNALQVVKAGTEYAVSVAEKTNIIVMDGDNYTCDNLSLVDKMPFAAPKAFTATTATYTRSLPDGAGWNSAVLPYDFDVTADMEVINNAMINGSSINFSEVATGETIPANTPFLYRKVGGGTITIENVDVEIAPQETTPTSGALLGTYVKIPAGEATGKLIMTQDGMGFATASALASIPAFRAYLNGGASSQVFTIVVGDEVTGMISADANVNEKVDVYTLDGKLIRTQVEAITALQGLENGTYIINGNKIKK